MAAEFAVDIRVNAERAGEVPVERLAAAVNWVLATYKAPPESGVTVVIADDDEVQRLNKQFRGIDAPTDVLSFSTEPDHGLADEGPPYLGDIVVGLPYVRRQAAAEQHSESDELVLAVVHGTLHLMSYDHDTPEKRRVMWTVQAEALHALGVDITVPSYDLEDDEEDLPADTLLA